MESQIFSVSEVSALINQTLEYEFPEIVIEGEVASFKINQNKWVFFDIKDNESTLGCFMSIYQLNTPLEDGMLVRVRCQPKLTKWGKFSLTVRSVELAGEGSVKKAFELLQASLEKEGLFATERKRSLPTYPKRIALITSRQAAAFNDFVTILSDRWGGVIIDHLQVQVQGESAPDQLTKAIDYCNASSASSASSDMYDVLVIIRGGGSAEDLQAFQTEPVVRAIYGSKIPTLVAIGHEDDVSLAELAADKRAATPTDAARQLVPDKKEIVLQIDSIQKIHTQYIQRAVHEIEQELVRFNHNASTLITLYDTKFNDNVNHIQKNIKNILERSQIDYRQLNALLRTLDPQAILARGYAIVRHQGLALKSVKNIQVKDMLMIQLAKGSIEAKVTKRSII